jgi:hypothetical protein
MPVENAVVERLVALGRPTGRLEPADLAAAVPLDSLSVLDLADLIDRLEDAGVAVGIDPRLLVARGPAANGRSTGPRGPDATAAAGARIGVFPRPAPANGAPTATHGRPAEPSPPLGHHHGAAWAVSPTVLAIGSMVVAVALILLVVGAGQPGG